MKRFIMLCITICLAFGLVWGLSAATFEPKTGDSKLDTTLKKLNNESESDLPGFKADVSDRFSIPLATIEKLLTTDNLNPAEVYFIAFLTKTTGKTVDEILSAVQANKGQGWGVIAKALGIKPGSKDFLELKRLARQAEGKASGRADRAKSSKEGKEGKGKGEGGGGGGNGGKK